MPPAAFGAAAAELGVAEWLAAVGALAGDPEAAAAAPPTALAFGACPLPASGSWEFSPSPCEWAFEPSRVAEAVPSAAGTAVVARTLAPVVPAVFPCVVFVVASSGWPEFATRFPTFCWCSIPLLIGLSSVVGRSVTATAVPAAVPTSTWADASASGAACDVTAAAPRTTFEFAEVLPVVLLLARLGSGVALAAESAEFAGGKSPPPIATLVFGPIASVAFGAAFSAVVSPAAVTARAESFSAAEVVALLAATLTVAVSAEAVVCGLVVAAGLAGVDVAAPTAGATVTVALPSAGAGCGAESAAAQMAAPGNFDLPLLDSFLFPSAVGAGGFECPAGKFFCPAANRFPLPLATAERSLASFAIPAFADGFALASAGTALPLCDARFCAFETTWRSAS